MDGVKIPFSDTVKHLGVIAVKHHHWLAVVLLSICFFQSYYSLKILRKITVSYTHLTLPTTPYV